VHELIELEIERVGQLSEHVRPGRVTWIDVQGLGDGSVASELGELFDLHHLAVADVVNTGQRPKAEGYEDVLFCVLRMALLREERVEWEQFSLFLTDSLVITFQETYGDCLDSLRDRLRNGRKFLRGSGADYLACMVIDAIVDGYFPLLEEYGEQLEDIEDEVLANPDKEVLERIYRLKRELMSFRRATWPVRELLSHLMRDEDERLTHGVLPYLRDTGDHVAQVADVVETYRELATSFVDVYLSSISNKINEGMRVLTVIATIFIPLTFLAGVYGMNFNPELPGNMPELDWPYGYAVFWGMCLVMVAMLLLLFRRLGWLSGR
jgi:magnesium transporter